LFKKARRKRIGCLSTRVTLKWQLKLSKNSIERIIVDVKIGCRRSQDKLLVSIGEKQGFGR